MPEEKVLVIPRSALDGFLPFRGFRSAQGVDLAAWAPQCSFKPRGPMESDKAYKQIIPYIVLRSGGQTFRYWRTKRGGEDRLHHRYSIGVGGHVNPIDDGLFSMIEGDLFAEAAKRELDEEVELSHPVELSLVGFLNDDEVEVGQYHLGVVYEAFLPEPQAALREAALGRGEWKPAHKLNDGVEYETWSQFVIDDYLLQS